MIPSTPLPTARHWQGIFKITNLKQIAIFFYKYNGQIKSGDLFINKT